LHPVFFLYVAVIAVGISVVFDAVFWLTVFFDGAEPGCGAVKSLAKNLMSKSRYLPTRTVDFFWSMEPVSTGS